MGMSRHKRNVSGKVIIPSVTSKTCAIKMGELAGKQRNNLTKRSMNSNNWYLISIVSVFMFYNAYS